jgi:hypothetical protein
VTTDIKSEEKCNLLFKMATSVTTVISRELNGVVGLNCQLIKTRKNSLSTLTTTYAEGFMNLLAFI